MAAVRSHAFMDFRAGSEPEFGMRFLVDEAREGHLVASVG